MPKIKALMYSNSTFKQRDLNRIVLTAKLGGMYLAITHEDLRLDSLQIFLNSVLGCQPSTTLDKRDNTAVFKMLVGMHGNGVRFRLRQHGNARQRQSKCA